MADVKLKDLNPVTTPTTSQSLLVFDESTNAGNRINYDLLADAILNKITTKNYTLDAGSQTLISALNALNSKTKAFNDIPPLSSVNVGGNKKLVLTMNAGSANYRGFLVLFIQGNSGVGNPQICMFSWGNGGTAVTVSHILGANTVYDGATIDGSNTAAVKVTIPMVGYETISAFASANAVSGVLSIQNV